MPTLPSIPVQIPPPTGFDPTTELYPQNSSIVVSDPVGPTSTNRQHQQGIDRDEALRNAINGLQGYVQTVSDSVLWVDGTRPMTGNLNMGGNRIINLGAPSAGTDATTKTYVDTADLLLLPLNGARSMTGTLNMGGNQIKNVGVPTENTDGTTKLYVDTMDLLLLPRDGSRPMTGNLNANSFRIVNLASPDPAQGGHAVNIAHLIQETDKLIWRDGTRFMRANLLLGDGTNNFRIQNLAPGISGTDGVNLNQINALDRSGRVTNIQLIAATRVTHNGGAVTPAKYASQFDLVLPSGGKWSLATVDFTTRIDDGGTDEVVNGGPVLKILIRYNADFSSITYQTMGVATLVTTNKEIIVNQETAAPVSGATAQIPVGHAANGSRVGMVITRTGGNVLRFLFTLIDDLALTPQSDPITALDAGIVVLHFSA